MNVKSAVYFNNEITQTTDAVILICFNFFLILINFFLYMGIYYKHITHYQTYSLDRMALELALIRVKFNLP